MVRGILADNHFEGFLEIIIQKLESAEWRELWDTCRVPVRVFEDIELDRGATDRQVWIACQREEIILVTANRNQHGPESLETAIRELNSLNALPVLTVGNLRQLGGNRKYVQRVSIRLLDILMNIDSHLGAGRIYLP